MTLSIVSRSLMCQIAFRTILLVAGVSALSCSKDKEAGERDSDAGTSSRNGPGTADASSVPEDGGGVESGCRMSCDDGFPCTIDSCRLGECIHTIGPRDGDTACPPGEYCTVEGGCIAAPACADDKDCVEVWSGDACKADPRCDPASSVCLFDLLDKDGDRHAPHVCGGGDCNDDDSTVYPGAYDICDGVDDDCNGRVDDENAEFGWTPCSETNACVDGECRCLPDNICGDDCVDLERDSDHCGSCFTECPSPAVCVEGECRCDELGSAESFFPVSLAMCAGACVDLLEDDRNCGACGETCHPDAFCSDSECVCNADTTTDPLNCGACGAECPDGEDCVDGECQNKCETSDCVFADDDEAMADDDTDVIFIDDDEEQPSSGDDTSDSMDAGASEESGGSDAGSPVQEPNACEPDEEAIGTYCEAGSVNEGVQLISCCDNIICWGNYEEVPVGEDGSNWTEVLTARAPQGRETHAMTFDESRGRAILFGGRYASGCYFGDTWEYDGADWIQASPASSAPGRQGHALAYDTARERVVLFGGWNGGIGPLNDTWEYDGETWIAVPTPVSPPPRDRFAMAFDAARKRVVLFGGYGITELLNDTWEYDGNTWTEVSTPIAPVAREFHALAYDATRERIVLFGGLDGLDETAHSLDDTWEFDGESWVQVSTPTSPSGRHGHALTYDGNGGQILLFGGFGVHFFLGDTWRFDGSTWTQGLPSASPPRRVYSTSTYDSARQRVVLFGGFGANNLNDTWEYVSPVPGVAR